MTVKCVFEVPHNISLHFCRSPTTVECVFGQSGLIYSLTLTSFIGEIRDAGMFEMSVISSFIKKTSLLLHNYSSVSAHIFALL